MQTSFNMSVVFNPSYTSVDLCGHPTFYLLNTVISGELSLWIEWIKNVVFIKMDERTREKGARRIRISWEQRDVGTVPKECMEIIVFILRLKEAILTISKDYAQRWSSGQCRSDCINMMARHLSCCRGFWRNCCYNGWWVITGGWTHGQKDQFWVTYEKRGLFIHLFSLPSQCIQWPHPFGKKALGVGQFSDFDYYFLCLRILKNNICQFSSIFISTYSDYPCSYP